MHRALLSRPIAQSHRDLEGITLSDGSREVHIVMNLPNTSEVVEFSSNDELIEDPQEDPLLGEHLPDHDVKHH